MLNEAMVELFCQEYVANGCSNAGAAMQKVKPNATRKTCWNSASEWLKKDQVRKRVSELLQEHYKERFITAEKIAIQLDSIAFDDTGNVSTKDKLQALALLQKQLGLQTQVVKADVNTINVTIEEEENDSNQPKTE